MHVRMSIFMLKITMGIDSFRQNYVNNIQFYALYTIMIKVMMILNWNVCI